MGDFFVVVKEIECILRHLEALGENLEFTRLEFVLEDKFPGWVFEKISQANYVDDSTWSFRKMRNLL